MKKFDELKNGTSHKVIRGHIRPRIGGKSTKVKDSASHNLPSNKITEPSETEDYSNYNKQKLIDKLKVNGLNTTGTLRELRERQIKFDKNKKVIDINIQENLHSKEMCDSCSANQDFLVKSAADALAEFLCETCDDKICVQCKLAHKRLKMTRDHKIIPLNNFINKSRVTSVRSTATEVEVNDRDISIHNKSIPWYSQSLEKENNKEANDVNEENDKVEENDTDIHTDVHFT